MTSEATVAITEIVGTGRRTNARRDSAVTSCEMVAIRNPIEMVLLRRTPELLFPLSSGASRTIACWGERSQKPSTLTTKPTARSDKELHEPLGGVVARVAAGCGGRTTTALIGRNVARLGVARMRQIRDCASHRAVIPYRLTAG